MSYIESKFTNVEKEQFKEIIKAIEEQGLAAKTIEISLEKIHTFQFDEQPETRYTITITPIQEPKNGFTI